jgi:Zn-dependent protease
MSGTLVELVIAVVAAVLAITLHEAAHGFAALALGDTTARDAKRLTLNPLRHIDRVGTILLPGFLLLSQLVTIHHVVFMFGWAKPVPVAAWRFRDPRRGMALVACAGPAMNFFLAWAAAVLMPATSMGHGGILSGVMQFLVYFMITNLVLGLFNLLPIPPLDGGRIAVGLLPLQLARLWARLERAGLIIVLLVVFVLPQLLGYNPVNTALDQILFRWAIPAVFWLAGHHPNAADVSTI